MLKHFGETIMSFPFLYVSNHTNDSKHVCSSVAPTQNLAIPLAIPQCDFPLSALPDHERDREGCGGARQSKVDV